MEAQNGLEMQCAFIMAEYNQNNVKDYTPHDYITFLTFSKTLKLGIESLLRMIFA